MARNIVARADAAARGDLTYKTGLACKRGHDLRYVSAGACVQCNLDRGKRLYAMTRNTAIRRVTERVLRIRANPDLNRDYVAARRDLNRKYKNIPQPTREQPIACECCGGPPNGRYKRLHVDHCYLTGKFRGWLCFKCNNAIGLLGDSVEGLLMAIQYLRKFND